MPKADEKYFTYDQIKSFLEAKEKAYPELLEVGSIGKSFLGRDILLATITNKKSGPHREKPAMYIDGNHHAGEVTGSAVCLYTIEYLLDNYATNQEIKELLDTKALYIVPRVSPDGAELYLTSPHYLRSSVRPFPDEDLSEGLVPEDLDGNGMILDMRWESPSGQWKISQKDPRVMVRRKPGETGGTYYRLATEGTFNYYDGVELKRARPKWGLDLNRNYPGNWHPASLQTGPGPYPLSEPETRSVADFFRDHPNVAMALSYHTSGGVILRPRTAGPDKDIPRPDLSLLTAIGRRGQEITGYPCVSIFEGFTIDQRRPSTGSFLDFTFDVLGVMAFAVELWDLRGRAGIPRRDLRQEMNLSEDQQEEDQLKIMAYVDKELAGEGFHPWTPFNHPQLGPLEIGGFDPKFLRQNPPVKLLGQECHKNAMFSLMLANTLPQVSLRAVKPCQSKDSRTSESKQISTDHYRADVTLENKGYLPTSSTHGAQSAGVVKPIKVKVILKDGVSIVSGKEYEELPHLPGWGSAGGFGMEKKISFIFKTDRSFEGEILAHLIIESERAGSLSIDITAPRRDSSLL